MHGADTLMNHASSIKVNPVAAFAQYRVQCKGCLPIPCFRYETVAECCPHLEEPDALAELLGHALILHIVEIELGVGDEGEVLLQAIGRIWVIEMFRRLILRLKRTMPHLGLDSAR